MIVALGIKAAIMIKRLATARKKKVYFTQWESIQTGWGRIRFNDCCERRSCGGRRSVRRGPSLRLCFQYDFCAPETDLNTGTPTSVAFAMTSSSRVTRPNWAPD